MKKITWFAEDISLSKNVSGSAKTIRGAVRAARLCIDNELSGRGKITICEDGHAIRIDEKDVLTNFRWINKVMF